MTDTSFFSRKNQVYPVLRSGRAAVEKHFSSLPDWERERQAYGLLDGIVPVPTVYEARPGVLVLGYLPLPTLLDELERQEREGFSLRPWEALARWISLCRERTGLTPGEGNLRNFLWDSTTERIYGLDLEEYGADPPAACGGGIAAAVLDYRPAMTPCKRQIASVLAEQLGAERSDVYQALEKLRCRRRGRPSKAISGIVLAGGASHRMGRDKAALSLAGRTLLQRQTDKMRRLGIQDILLSGGACPALPGTRVIADEIPGQGPLGGLYSCLRAAKNDVCLVIGVDTPLVPANALAQMSRAHSSGVTLLRQGEREEPLIGVYDSALSGAAGKMLAQGQRSIRVLYSAAAGQCWDYKGPKELLLNCNRPEDWIAAQELAAAYAAAFPGFI